MEWIGNMKSEKCDAKAIEIANDRIEFRDYYTFSLSSSLMI